jgi:transposase InsO family protein
VVQVLERVAQERGLPEVIQVDNGPEFSSRVVDQWAHAHGVVLHFIDPGKPVQNAFIESFNGKFRDECLNQSWAYQSGGCTAKHRGLARGLQHGASSQQSRVSDAGRVRRHRRRATGVSPHAGCLGHPSVGQNGCARTSEC